MHALSTKTGTPIFVGPKTKIFSRRKKRKQPSRWQYLQIWIQSLQSVEDNYDCTMDIAKPMSLNWLV